MNDDVTVVIPTIPPRRELLGRALASVIRQTHPAASISVAVDNQRQGAAATRQRALDGATGSWVAFLDDDDEFKPEHLERLLWCAGETGADYVFSWFDTQFCHDPLGHFGRVYDVENPTHTTITVMVRRELAQEAGFRLDHPDGWTLAQEDWRFTLDCIRLGAKIVHLPERTWYWHHDSGNTSGRPDRW